MINELDNKYLVLKISDIEKYIDNANKRKLDIMLSKLRQARHQDGKKANKNYVVVSEDMKCHDFVESIVIDEINGEDHLEKIRRKWEDKVKEELAKEYAENYKPAAPKKAAPKKVAPKKKVTTNVKNKD